MAADDVPTWFVDAAEGDDTAAGTLEKPLATLAAAVAATRAAAATAADPAARTTKQIVLRAGATHYLSKTLVLDARDSGLTIMGCAVRRPPPPASPRPSTSK